MRSGNALVVEVRDLLAQDEVFEQRRPAEAGLEGVLIVTDRHSEVGGQGLPGAIRAHTIERRDGLILTNGWRSTTDLVRTVGLGHGTGADDRIVGRGGDTLRRRSRRIRLVLERLSRS